MLSARVIKQFIPARSTQLRASLERISTSISKAFKSKNTQQNSTQVKSYSDIGIIDESFDELEFVEGKSFAKIRALAKQPFLFGLLVISIFSIFYSRNRFGSLSGGALPVAPDSAMHLISDFFTSWHLVGLGSSSPTPLWVLIVGLASVITGGNPQILIYLFFFFIPSLLYVLTYRSARKFNLSNYSATFAGFVFALSPAILTSINQGRIGTLVVAAFSPILFTALYNHQQLTDLKWRKLYLITIVAAITAAFSPIFLLIWLGYHLYQLIDQYIASKNSNSTKWEDISKILNQDEIKKRFALLITPFLFNIPNSFSFLFAPTSKLLEPGLSVPSGDFFSILLFNPGGPASPNLYLLAPFILYLILCLVVKQQRRNAVLALILLVFSATISSFFIVGNNSPAQRVWSGSLIIIAQFILTLNIFSIGERIIPQLRTINFGYKHILSAVTALITILSTVVMAGWGVTVGANSLVSTDNDQVIPAFISDLATTNERPKTLVVRKNQEQLKYFITRGSDLLLGEPDVSSKTPEIVHTSIVDLFNGVGVSSSQILGFYGIQYVFMKDPADPALVRTIDGIGGFTRSSATKDGVIWKVR